MVLVMRHYGYIGYAVCIVTPGIGQAQSLSGISSQHIVVPLHHDNTISASGHWFQAISLQHNELAPILQNTICDTGAGQSE